MRAVQAEETASAKSLGRKPHVTLKEQQGDHGAREGGRRGGKGGDGAELRGAERWVFWDQDQNPSFITGNPGQRTWLVQPNRKRDGEKLWPPGPLSCSPSLSLMSPVYLPISTPHWELQGARSGARLGFARRARRGPAWVLQDPPHARLSKFPPLPVGASLPSWGGDMRDPRGGGTRQ